MDLLFVAFIMAILTLMVFLMVAQRKLCIIIYSFVIFKLLKECIKIVLPKCWKNVKMS